MEEYLTPKQLSKRIPYAEGTIRNLIWKDVFKEDLHYVKPTPRKILFIWSRVEDWLYGKSSQELSLASKINHRKSNLINI